MRRLAWAGVTLCLFTWIVAATAARPTASLVVLVSIDGLSAEDLIEADRRSLRIPNLRRLARDGASAERVKGVLPTVTYPSHTTLVTGVSPRRHGIWTNRPFDPAGRNDDGWFFYAEDIRAQTLWQAASQAGFTTSSVDWPVTVGAEITYNIAQFWRSRERDFPDHVKLARALSTKGLLAEAEHEVGRSYPAGYAYTVDDDARRASFSEYLLATKRSHLHLAYFSGLDEARHRHGPASPEARAALERIDGLVGRLRAAADAPRERRAVFAVVSDHGFAETRRELHVNAGLHGRGLIELDSAGRVVDWRAFAWGGGGSVGIYLKHPNDDEARARALDLLTGWSSAGGPVRQLLNEEDARRRGGFPGAAFVALLRNGVRFGYDGSGAVERTGGAQGEHGFDPEDASMDAVFLIAGPSVPRGRKLGAIDMRDVAPTLAARLGLRLPEAEGRDVLF